MIVYADTAEMRAAFFKALAKAQSEYKELRRTKTVRTKTYTFDYAPLEEVFAAVEPALNANGIFLSQPLDRLEDGTEVLVTVLAHESGAYMRSATAVPKSGTMQELGSDLTYLKRYAVSAMVGVSPENDDDGTRGQAESVGPRQSGGAFPQEEASTKNIRGKKDKGFTQHKDEPPVDDDRATNPDKPSREALESLRSFMVSAGYKTQEQRSSKYEKLVGKLPPAFTRDDVAVIIKAVEAEEMLNGGHVA